ncbi:arylesterase [Aliikangiella marina]|uniref:Arylesterase n=1 Tax=Aliikangiella marina TaxID=1712262 RepID=A0A545T501_9GAMM|nr:GDSL-type esterase/lipase family protein [Aliikangiella marina]TQV72327.1 arylesterase [Aliikangiella marina]
MLKLKSVLLIIFTFAVIGCSEPKLPPLAYGSKIVAFGDSLTYGVGSGNGPTYPQALAELTGFEVVNEGISGETTTGGLQRFAQVLDKHQPDMVILMEGGNDILRNHNPKTTKQNLATMIEIAQAREIRIIFMGVPEKKLFSDSAPFYQELAEQYALVYDGDSLSELLRSRQYKSDPIHLNGAGYQALANRIYQLMQTSGAID